MTRMHSDEMYKMGMCDVFAIASHRFLEKPLYVVRGYYRNKNYDPELEDDSDPEFLEENCHAVVKVDDDRYFDVGGIKEGDELMDACYFENPVKRIEIVEVGNEEDLSDLFTCEGINEDDVEDATDIVKEKWERIIRNEKDR
jgi:hypothetical protein